MVAYGQLGVSHEINGKPGYNHSVPPLTCAHVYRWLRASHEPYFDGHVLHTGDVKNVEVLRYSMEQKGPEIPSESAEILRPGDYSWTPKRRFHVLRTLH